MALQSAFALENRLTKELPIEIFEEDCTQPLPEIAPDIIITDIPYGNLVSWSGDAASPLTAMLARLADISSTKTILALCMAKQQKLVTDRWVRIEKQSVGKRRFEILKKSISLLPIPLRNRELFHAILAISSCSLPMMRFSSRDM